MSDQDPDTFTQKDLMQHLLHAAQHSVTREEMAAQFLQSERINQEKFKLIDKRFDDLEREVKEQGTELRNEIKEQGIELRKEIKEHGIELRKEIKGQSAELKLVIKEQDVELKQAIKEQGKRHDRLSWAIFAGMSAIFFKEYIVKALGI